MPKFVPRERKHKRLAKQSKHGTRDPTEPQDVNAEVVLPVPAAEKEAKRQKLREDIRAQQQQDKISSKKRKRLDHYVETKLRREENADLIHKLAGQKVDTSLLQSSKKLGRVNESKREAFERALREKNAGIDVRGDQTEVLYKTRSSDAHQHLIDHAEDDASEGPSENGNAISPPLQPSSGLFGSGLKRPLELGEGGQPLIKRRKRQKKKPVIHGRADESEDVDLEWTGFESDNEQDLPIGYSDGVDDAASNDSDTDESETDEDISDDADSVQSTSRSSEGEETDGISDDGSVSDSVEDHAEDTTKPRKSSAFKQWAESQRNEALGFVPSRPPTNETNVAAAFRPRQPSPDPVAQELTASNTSKPSRPSNAITISRDEVVQKARLELPVVQEEQRIMEAVHNHQTVVICGATGSGKTTQIPQILFESGYGSHCGLRSQDRPSTSTSLQNKGMIGVTQPRRVAAVSVAERVATELGDGYKDRVAHQVRYDTTASSKTAIKFMTDGILLREIGQDFVLSKYSAIIIDEAHERSVNTDILIGMLSRIVNLRNELAQEDPSKHCPLRLVIMSATLRVADFTQNERLFRDGAPPIVQAEGRQYPVTVHFARKTQQDFVSETITKVIRGHRKLPPGAMLVFLTGQNEIHAVAKGLRKTLGNTASSSEPIQARESADQLPLETDDMDALDRRSKVAIQDEDQDDSDAEITGLDEEDEREFDIESIATSDQQAHPATSIPRVPLKAHILPLYASLPTVQQMRVFQPPRAGSRLIVLATNVAETSLTIPGIQYVFDCGRSKEKRYDHDTGVQTFEVDWISKASASQRTGRAGRTGPGHCWRLYSSAVYEEFFAEHTVPEVLRTPIEGTVLQLKAMGVDNVANFPFPTPPDRMQLQKAEVLLKNLGAIKSAGTVTAIGRELIQYPISPRFGRMLLIAARNGVLNHAIAIVAGLAVGDLFIPELQDSTQLDADGDDDSSSDERSKDRQLASALATESQKRHQTYTRTQAMLSRWDDHSDSIKLLTAVAAHADAVSRHGQSNGAEICQKLYLREKGMAEVQQLRQQLHSIVRAQRRNSASPPYKLELTLADEKQRKMLNQVVTAGFLDQVAIRADMLPKARVVGRKARRAIEVAYRPLIPLDDAVDRSADGATQDAQRNVYVHASSVLARLGVDEMPGYVVYSHLSRSAPKVDAEEGARIRTRMHPLTAIGAKALAALAEETPLLEIGKPIGKIEEKDGGKKRVCWAAVGLKPPAGQSSALALEWPLGAWKVEQARGKRGEWKLETVLAR